MNKGTALQRLREAFRASQAALGEEANHLDEDEFLADLQRGLIAEGEALEPDRFPDLGNLSAAFMYRFLPIPREQRQPEFVYVPSTLQPTLAGDRSLLKESITVTDWNICWEAGHLRHDLFRNRLPPRLKWLRNYRDQNVFLLPRTPRHRYCAYSVLFHMIPRAILQRHGLPLLRRGLWPHYLENYWRDCLLPADFDRRLSRAFGDLVWNQLVPGSGHSSFSASEPIRILAHNLDFWLPYAHEVAENRLRQLPRVRLEGEDRKVLKARRASVPSGIQVHRPRKGGLLWEGERDALEAVRELVEIADAEGRLQGILDAVRSHRVEEDFSGRWSFAREDFERKLYRKRAKIKVKFVELNETVPVHGPESEVLEDLLWEDFLGLLNPKEREITVLLRSGVTRLGDIAKHMGYANHSPISKALSRIRRVALDLLT